MSRTMRSLVGAAWAVALLGAAACGMDDSGDGDGDSGGGAGGEPTELTVFAAASLTTTFTELGERFEAAHDDVTVTFNFAGSSDLVAQLQQGAPADVFASADTANMDKAADDRLLEGEPVAFASNTLEIAVPPDNPASVESFADLARPGVQLVVCAPEVPCGAATEKVEAATGVTLSPVSEESSVTDVLGKVVTGQADAGLVYVTDVRAAGDEVKGIGFPESSSAVNVYPIAALAGSEHPEIAQQFVDLLTTEAGQAVLADAGFARP